MPFAKPERCIVCKKEFPATHMIYLHTEKTFICKECYWPEMRRRYPSRPVERLLTFWEKHIRDMWQSAQEKAIQDQLAMANYLKTCAARNKERARQFKDPKMRAAWQSAAKIDEEGEQYFRELAEKRRKAVQKAQTKEIWQHISMFDTITYDMWNKLTDLQL